MYVCMYVCMYLSIHEYTKLYFPEREGARIRKEILPSCISEELRVV